MKVLVKALKRKQLFSHIILCILITLTLLSIQVSVMVYSRENSIINRIDQMKVAHTMAMTKMDPYNKGKALYQFLDDYQEQNGNITYEKAYVYPYYAYPTAHMQRYFPIYLEGFVKSDNGYPLIEGKKLANLKGNEIAIMQSYASKLKQEGIDPIGYKIKLPSLIEGEIETFVVKSIFEYPNFDEGYLKQDITGSASNYFESATSAVGIVNNDTLAKIYEKYVQTKAEVYEGDIMNCIAKIHFDHYSVQDEYNLRSSVFNNYVYENEDMDGNYDVVLLADEMNANKVTQGIFEFISLSVSITLCFSSFFVFYAYMKRKLLEDKEKLSIMAANGVLRKNISRAYMRMYANDFIISTGAWILITCIFIVFIQKFAPYDITLLFPFNFMNFVIAGGIAIIFFLFINIMIHLQVHSTLKGSLFQTLKKGHLHLSRRKKPIGYKRQTLFMAMRDIVTQPFTSMRNIISLGIVLMSVSLLISTYSLLTNLYNKDTYGLQFDYILDGGIAYDDFMELDEEYIDKYAFMEYGSLREYLVDDRSFRDIVDINFYPGVQIHLTGKLDDFVTLQEGVYPTDTTSEEASEMRFYAFQKGMIPRRLAHDFDRRIYSEDLDSKDTLKAYVGVSDGSPWGTSSRYIYGYTDSLANNGYIIYTRSNMMPINQENYPEFPTTILYLKDQSKAKAFEKALQKKGYTFDSYDKMLKVIQKNNNEVNGKLFYVMFVVMGLCFITLLITLYANVKADIAQKKEENECFYRIGISHSLILKREWIRQLIMLALAILFAIVLFAIVQFPYFDMLGIKLGLFKLPTYSYAIFMVFMGIIILSMITSYFISGKKK